MQSKKQTNTNSFAQPKLSLSTSNIPMASEPLSSASMTAEFTSEFGTTATSGTEAVSQIFAEGGFQSKRRSRLLILTALGLIVGAFGVLYIGGPETSVEDPDSDPTTTVVEEPDSATPTDTKDPVDEVIESFAAGEVLQDDLSLRCEILEEYGEESMVRYGCNAYLKTGEYYGNILGWWKATNNAGVRVPVFDLEFRDDEFDTTFSVRTQQSLADINVVPWIDRYAAVSSKSE